MGSPGHRNLTRSPDVDRSYYDDGDIFESSTQILIVLSRFQTYLPPLLIVAGTLGNLSSFLALRRPALARHSMGLYLTAHLTVSTAYLYAGCGLDWLSLVSGLPNVSHLADWTCRLWKFVFGVVRHAVDWLLVAMVTDRLVATRRTLAAYRPVLCTPFVARVTVIGVFVGLTVVAIHAMWIYGLVEDEEAAEGSCTIDRRQRDIGSVAWPWLSAVTLSYIPGTIVLVLTPLLTVEYLRGGGCRRRCRGKNPTVDDEESSVDRNETTGDSTSSSSSSSSSSVQSGFTLCCICTAVTFLLCTVPANVVNLFWHVNPPDLLTLYSSFVTCSIVTCVQSSAAFVWCNLCVRNVRTEFRTMLGEISERCSSRIRRADVISAEMRLEQEQDDEAKNTDSTLV